MGTTMKHTLTLLSALLLAPLAAPHLHAAPNNDFDRKAAALFTKTYSFHPWNETNHTVDGEDWSLPSWVAMGFAVDLHPRIL
jgi:hypothetical protein